MRAEWRGIEATMKVAGLLDGCMMHDIGENILVKCDSSLLCAAGGHWALGAGQMSHVRTQRTGAERRL